MNLKKSILLYLLFSSLFALVSGCASQTSLAPVVNGWYQKNAASNFYVVQSGDTIYSIAFAFGLDYRVLASVNDLRSPFVIRAGKRLRMTHQPAGQYHTPAPSKPAQSSPVLIKHSMIVPRALISHVPVIHHTSSSTPAQNFSDTRWCFPTKGAVIRSFSRSPSGHPGIAIAGQLGQPVRAARSGVVVYSGDGVRGYGNLIIIKHNDAYLSAYAFNQKNLVRVGDRVRAGTVIAHMGRDDAGHTLLYFEIRYNGLPEDPLKYVR